METLDEIKWQIQDILCNHTIGFITTDEMLEQIQQQVQRIKTLPKSYQPT